MELIKNLLTENHATEMSSDDRQKWHMKAYNGIQGKLPGYDCKLCLNRGDYMVMQDGRAVVKMCKCMTVRRAIAETANRIESTGIKEMIKLKTFESYIVKSSWQKSIVDAARCFLKDYHNKWFYFGGQVGSGKSHICTALIGDFIKKGMDAAYMLWRDEVALIKGCVMNAEEYEKRIRPIKEVKVLYIDDFLKTDKETGPSKAERDIAFEIINYRYIKPELITIISSELFLDAVIAIDKGIGSRIYEKSKDYCLIVDYDDNKNYRLTGGTSNG